MRNVARFCLRVSAAAALMLAGATACRAQQTSPPVTSSATTPDATTVTADSIATLPVESRDWQSLTQLSSQANDATTAGGTTGDVETQADDGNARTESTSAETPASGESYAGQSPTQNTVTLDGLSAQQNFRSGPRGGAASGSTFSQGAVGSFRVMPRIYSAAFGNAAGAVLAIQSRAGSEKLHGGATLLFRESAFDAANPFSIATNYNDGAITSSVVKPENSMVQMAAHVGLPLGDWLGEKFHAPALRKRLVLFVSYEEELKNDPIVSSPATASFYALTPEQTALLANRGVDMAQINTALNYIDSLTGTVPRSSTRGLGFLRLDETLSKRDRLAFTYVENRFHSPAGAGFSSASNAVMARSRASVGDSFIAIDAMAAHWQHAFSSHVENALRFQFVRDDEHEEPRAPLPQEPAIGPGGYAPQVTIQPEGFAYGTPSSLGRSAYPDEQRVELAEGFDALLGRHHFIAGGSWSRIHDLLSSTSNVDGSFSYDSGATGGFDGGLADWITDYTFGVHAYPNGGCPSINAQPHYFCFHSFTQSFGATQSEFVLHDFAGYAEDSFRARHDLTLTLGARYEYTLLPFPHQPNFVLDESLQAAAAQLGAATASFPEDRNNIGPRVSIAWSPHSLLTARLGYGFFYGRLPGATVNAALTDTALPTSTTRVRITPKTEVDCPQVAMQGFGYPCDFVSAPPAAVTQTTSSLLFAKNFRLPTVQRASLTLEHAFGKRAMLRAEYAMVLTTQLPSTTDLNIAPATSTASFVVQGGAGHKGLQSGEMFSVPLYTARRLTQYGPISALVSNANSTYHAATLEAELREARGFSVHTSFTFSRAIDYAPLQSATPQTDGQFDPFSNGYDKGLSSLQFPFRFSGNVNWHSHFDGGTALQRRLLQNWRVSAIATAGSGAPYSYNIFGGTALSGGRETINGSGGATYLPTIGRNTLRLPARGNVNLRLARSFDLQHGLRLEAFAEAFNLLNERNLSRVDTRAFLLGTPAAPGAPTPLIFQDAATIASEGLNTPAFGAPTSSTTGLSRERQAELGLKLEF